jgi:serralysin
LAAAINGTANRLANTITGNAAANVLNEGTGAGNDSPTGGLGADHFFFASASGKRLWH